MVRMRNECENAREDLGKLRSSSSTRDKDDTDGTNSSFGKVFQSCDGGEAVKDEHQEEVAVLKDRIGELSLKLQNSAFQKARLEREVEGMLSENTVLSKNLVRAEAELAELHTRYEELSDNCTMEDASVTSSVPVAPVSPFRSASFAVFRKNNSSLSTTASHHEHVMETGKSLLTSPLSTGPPDSGMVGESLFSEFDTQFSSLQQSYGELLHKCTCSASLAHRPHRNGGTGGIGGTSENGGSSSSSSSSGAFKELFDEVFATLRQTAQVADRLIEKRRN